MSTPYVPGPGPDAASWRPVQAPAPPPRRKHTAAIVFSILGAVLLCLVGSFVVAGLATSSEPTEDPTAIVTTDGTKGAPAERGGVAVPTKAAAVSSKIKDGTWRVGRDVKPGDYRTAGAGKSVFQFCHWSVKKGGHTVDFGAVNGEVEPGLVTIEKGQIFETSGCRDWILQ